VQKIYSFSVKGTAWFRVVQGKYVVM